MPDVEKALLKGLDPGLYIWDNYKGNPLFARSLDENEELRKEADEEMEAEAEAEERRSR